MYPRPPNHLINLTDRDELARKRLIERDQKARDEWTFEKVDPGRGPVAGYGPRGT